MKAIEISRSKKGMCQLVIHHTGRGYTRHCKPVAGGWLGQILDEDKRFFDYIENGSKNLEIELRKLGTVGMPTFKPDMMFVYHTGKDIEDEYHAHCVKEAQRAHEIIEQQNNELTLATAMAVARQAVRQSHQDSINAG